MANIINRFSRKIFTPQSPSPSTELVHVDENNIPIPSEKEASTSELIVGSSESKTNQSHNPELVIDPIAVDEESVIEEDLRDIPVEVRNTVSFEDELALLHERCWKPATRYAVNGTIPPSVFELVHDLDDSAFLNDNCPPSDRV
jgi:hypothetical protein